MVLSHRAVLDCCAVVGKTTAAPMAAHWRSDQSRANPCAGELRGCVPRISSISDFLNLPRVRRPPSDADEWNGLSEKFEAGLLLAQFFSWITL